MANRRAWIFLPGSAISGELRPGSKRMPQRPTFRPKPVPKQESKDILVALQRARQISDAVVRATDRIWNQPGKKRVRWDRRRTAWRSNASFVLWLGDEDLTAQQIRRTRERIMTLDRRLNMKLIIHIHRETGGDCAGTFAFHTRGSGKRRIHICQQLDRPYLSLPIAAN